MLMNWEQTDRVRAEAANDSSSEKASGDSIRFPPWGEAVELHWGRLRWATAEVIEDAKRASGMSLSLQHWAGPAMRSQSSLGGGAVAPGMCAHGQYAT